MENLNELQRQQLQGEQQMFDHDAIEDGYADQIKTTRKRHRNLNA